MAYGGIDDEPDGAAGLVTARLRTDIARLERALERERERVAELEQSEATLQASLHALRHHQDELHARNQELVQAQRALADSGRRYKGLFELAPVCFLAFDSERRVIDANIAAARLTGQAPPALQGRLITAMFTDLHRARLDAHLEAVDQGRVSSVELDMRRLEGGAFTVLARTMPLGGMGEREHYVMAIMDISERKAAERELRRSRDYLDHLAHHDSLTGLPNRLLFSDRLHHAIARAERSGKLVGIVFFDLDRFKSINDSLGHAVGDGLLQAVAHRLGRDLRAQDTIARLGGDEFIVLVEDVVEEDDVERVADKIRDSFARPFEVDGHSLAVTASIGISLYPGDARSPQELLGFADASMYRAKELGRDNVQFYARASTDDASD